MDIANNIAQKIKEGDIKPIPKRYFVVRHILVWTAVVGTITLTGIACSVVVYLLQSHEWGMRSLSGESLTRHVIVSLPYFWLVLAGGLLCLSILNTKWLRRGYAIRPALCFGLYGVIALLVGVTIAETGRAALIDREAARIVPKYESMVDRPEEDWDHPELGLLGGELQSVSSAGFVLVDHGGAHWSINTENIDWRCGAMKRMGNFVKFVGTMSRDGAFSAQSALPWDVTLAGSTHCLQNRALIPCTYDDR